MADPKGFAVRRAEESDAAKIIELRQALLTETSFMLWEFGEFEESVEQEAKRISRLNGRDNCLMILAVARVADHPDSGRFHRVIA